jgi:fumarate hydratase class II
MEYRKESDCLGEVQVPASALYGGQTQRAIHNFPISGRTLPREFIRALGLIKEAACLANVQLGRLDKGNGQAIAKAAMEVAEGLWDQHFVVDVYESGSGTSINMNANEVIANRANQLLGGGLGLYEFVHPNDHVNMGQSSNDVIPSAIHIAASETIARSLMPAMESLKSTLHEKSRQFKDVIKLARTHLQDALPITLGQEFSAYASQVGKAIDRLSRAVSGLLELPLGGTAVGTGLHAPPAFVELAMRRIRETTSIEFFTATNACEAVAVREAIVETSGHLKSTAVSLIKIANDIRWMSSGPRCGLGEINLPALQPGSSMMPGKVNPVIAESLMMACVTVLGLDAAIHVAATHGNFQLTAMMPMMADHLLESIRLLSNGCRNLTCMCISKIEPNPSTLREYAHRSISLVTSLVPVVGYDMAARIASEAYRSGKTVKDVALRLTSLSDEELDELLDPLSLIPSAKRGGHGEGKRE